MSSQNIKAKALQIKNETQARANSANRVGGLFEDIADELTDIESSISSEVSRAQAKEAELEEAVESKVNGTLKKTASADLAISDAQGHTLAEFSEGHFKVKNFDSRNVVSTEQISETNHRVSELEGAVDGKVDGTLKTSDADLAISDAQGHTLAEFSEGHFKVKNFDSRNVVSTKQISETNHRVSELEEYNVNAYNDTYINTEAINYVGGGTMVWLSVEFEQYAVVEIQIKTSSTTGKISLRKAVEGVRSQNDFVQVLIDAQGESSYKMLITDSLITELGFYFTSTAGTGEAEITIIKHVNTKQGEQFFALQNTNINFSCPTQEAMPTPASWTEWIYAQYDALMSAYPEYITRIDADAGATSALGIQIDPYFAEHNLHTYIYHFSPKLAPNSSARVDSDTECDRMRVLIITGTHAEYVAIVDTINMMRLICSSWQGNETLEELRHNVDFYVMPCHGPSVVENGTYANHNGVNLNRNAPVFFFKVQGEGTDNYTGTEPVYETKVLEYYINLIKPHIALDHHNANRAGHNKFMFFTSMYRSIINLMGYVTMKLTRKWKDERSMVFPPTEVNSFGFSRLGGTEPNTICQWLGELGIVALTFETNSAICYRNGEYTDTNPKEGDSDVVTCATETTIYVIANLVKYYSKLKNK